MSSTSIPQLALAARFAQALEAGCIDVHYQRIVELPTLRTVKVEALARWSDDSLVGPVPPDVFIELAEQHGLIRDLDLCVARRAVNDLARWRTLGWPDLAVAVNCSPLTLAEADLVPRMLDIIHGAGLPPSAVWVEVTESALVGPSARRTIGELAASGVRVALDDFGTGYSTLGNLRHLAVHALKIDRSFVSCADQDPAAVAMIRSIVGLGHELGHAVVAEGVETELEEQVLRRLGVTLLQGYRYSRPAPFDAAFGHRPPTSKVRPRPVAPGVPVDEEGRLRALDACGILDTAPERAYDALVQIAAEVCATPIASIALVDRDRQWFKSSIGVDASQTPRGWAFSSHAILGTETFVVENALEDARFARNPYVLGDPGIRFYAGAPLVTPDGHALGTLCVVDRRPRRLDGSQLRLLTALAEQVVAQLELRAVTGRLEANAHARTDQLTGLTSRRAFFVDLADRIERGTTGVLTIDLAGFGEINEAYGQDTGDELLVQVGRSIRTAVRRDDLAARMVGDRFAIAVEIDAAGRPSMRTMAQRMRAAIRQPRTIDGHIIVPDAAFGLAVSSPGDTATSLVRRAEVAMATQRLRRAPRPMDVHPAPGR